MARQTLNEKKVNKLRLKTGLDIVKVLVRGGTDHRLDLCIKGGEIISMYKDGTLEKNSFKWS